MNVNTVVHRDFMKTDLRRHLKEVIGEAQSFFRSATRPNIYRALQLQFQYSASDLERASVYHKIKPINNAIARCIGEQFEPARRALNIPEFMPYNINRIFTYTQGCYALPHKDADVNVVDAEIGTTMSFIYFFHLRPQGFFGGQLRLYAPDAGDIYDDIEPEDNKLVFFDSKVRQEIMPVLVPSGEFRDGLFTVTGWF